jgi:hypothetical protein
MSNLVAFSLSGSTIPGAYQTAFTNENTALNWVQNSGKYITLFTCSLYTGSIPFLLQEDGSYILQENGDRIILNF